MQIEQASEMGACPGVKRAFAIAEKAARERGRVHTLGPLVHNRQAVAHLSHLGIDTIEKLQNTHCQTIIIPAHGAPPEIWEEMKKRGLEIIDATCPIVRDAQKKAHELSQDDFQIVIFGNSGHPEVRGLLGQAGNQAQATQDAQNIILEQQKLGILSQTTQNQNDFNQFVDNLTRRFLASLKEMRVINTICDATSKRQEAAIKLSPKVDLILVIGGPDSANTHRLAEICAKTGVITHLIETATDIMPEWFKPHTRIGITAGTSTPDQTINEVIQTLQKL